MGMGSPFYQIKEYDLTKYIPSFRGIVGATVIDCAKGEVGQLHYITNETQLIERHGKPQPTKFGTSIYSAINFLKASDKLYTARVDKGQTYASALVRSIVDPIVDKDQYGRLLENPIVDPIVKPNGPMSKEDIEAYLFTKYERDREVQPFETPVHLVKIPSNGDTRLYVDSNSLIDTGSHITLMDTTGLDRTQTLLYDVYSVTGVGTEDVMEDYITTNVAVPTSVAVGTEVRKVNRSTSDIGATVATGAVIGDTSIDVNDGTLWAIGDIVSFDNAGAERYTITGIAGDTLSLDSALTADHAAGEIVYKVTEQYMSYNYPVYVDWIDPTDGTKVRVTSNDPIAENDEVEIDGVVYTVTAKHQIANTYNYVDIGDEFENQTGATIGSEVYEVTALDFEDRDAFLVYAESPGEWANDIAVAIRDSKHYEKAFIVEVYYKGVLEESFEVAREYMLNGDGRQMYIEDVINNQSKYIRVKDNFAMVDDEGVPTEPLKTLFYLRQEIKSPIYNRVAALTETAWDGDNYLRVDPADITNVDVNKPLQVADKEYEISNITSSITGQPYDTIILKTPLELGMDNLPPMDRFLPIGTEVKQYFDRAKSVTVAIPAYADGEVYTINLEGTNYSYTSAPGDDASVVYGNLVTQINGDANNIWATATQTADGVRLDGVVTGVDFNVTATANMVIVVNAEASTAWEIKPIEKVEGSILPTATVGAKATFNGVVYTILDAGSNRVSGGDDAGLATEGQFITALQMFENPEEVDFLIFMDAGITTVGYAQAINRMCENRMDCIGLLSVPFEAQANPDIQKVVDYRNELNINSSYVALYAPWVQVVDQYNDIRIWVQPESFAANAISYVSEKKEIFHVPAGWENGKVHALKVYKTYNKAMRDLLYDNQINPLRVHPNKGIAVWGNRNLQAIPSATDRINVRMELIVIERALMDRLDNVTFDINTEETRDREKANMDSFLGDIKARGGLYGYRVVCDETNNTPEVIARHEMYLDVYVEVVQGIEYPIGRVAITKAGASMNAVIQ